MSHGVLCIEFPRELQIEPAIMHDVPGDIEMRAAKMKQLQQTFDEAGQRLHVSARPRMWLVDLDGFDLDRVRACALRRQSCTCGAAATA